VEFGDEEFNTLLRATFAVKRVPLRFIGMIDKSREFHRPDFASVRSTVSTSVKVKDFDDYFDYVLEKCRTLESLWKE
jgi:hypothetical protein